MTSYFNEFRVKSDVSALVYIEFIRFRKFGVGEPTLENVTGFRGRRGCGYLLSVFDGCGFGAGSAVKHERYGKSFVFEHFVLDSLVGEF